MPFRVSWGPGAGTVTIVADSAREALSLARRYEEEGRGDITVSTFDGVALSVIELKALAAVEPADPAG